MADQSPINSITKRTNIINMYVYITLPYILNYYNRNELSIFEQLMLE